MPTRYSHPPEGAHDGVLLRDHLEDVAQRVGYVVPDDARTANDDPIRDIVETLAYVHDFGKATTYFQEYLLNGVDPDDSYCRYHAPLGAFAAYYALEAKGYDAETCLAGFVAVAKHHGRLPDVAEYVYERTHRRESIATEQDAEKQQTAVAKQINDINDHVLEFAGNVFDAATDGDGSWEEFCHRFAGNLLEDIKATVATEGHSEGIDRESLSDSCYALVLEFWSSLVLADKTSAAAAATDTEPSAATYEGVQPTADSLDDHVRSLEEQASADPDGTRAERLNHYRSEARTDVLENAASFADDGGGVATLTLPTGMGKTLSGLSAAMEIRDRRDGDRVVYALPFTSIIDQVVDELEDIYEVDTTGRLLTAHHHLSETTIRDEDAEDNDDAQADDADRNDDVAGMLGESWRAGLTVTTFVQLFESLAGPSNKQSMKLPALRNSVVVLDEPQSLPLDWWKLVPRLVALLTERYGATVIAMTATQPQLFDDATELVDDPETYFDATERVTYELDPSAERYLDDQTGPKGYDDAAATLLESAVDDESVLAVCNTIDSARTITDRVTDRLPESTDVAEVYAEELEHAGDVEDVDPRCVAERVADAGDRSVLHLSTRLRPCDRLRLIETAKALTQRDQKLLTISTQLVEAGVDISFDRVYRDLAPIDSIVQAAGRCNRSFERDRGRVVVWWLETPAEQEKTPAEAVYNRGTKLLPTTAKTLDAVRSGATISETTVARNAVSRYYDRLHDEKDVGADAYPTYVDEANGHKLAELSLIDKQLAIDVIVCRTAADRRKVNEIRDALNRYDFDAVDSLMRELRPKQISVPVYRSGSEEAQKLAELDTVHGESDIRWVDTTKPHYNGFFDETTGFVVPDSTAERRLL